MDLNLLAILLTALLSILAAFGGVHSWVKKLIKAIKESTDVGVALDNAISTIDQVIADNIVEKGEIEEVKAKFEQVKTEINQAKDSWKGLFNKHAKYIL